MRRHKRAKLADGTSVAAERQVNLDAVLGDAHSKLVQPGDLWLRELFITHVGQGSAAPEAEGLPQVSRRPVRRVLGERAAALLSEPLEAAYDDAVR